MTKAAQNGLPLAMHALGFMYFEGECTEKNSDLCIKWFERAAQEGMMGSATTLGMIYEEGKIVEQDLKKAEEWYRKAGIQK
jgi:TPR repeat protein